MLLSLGYAQVNQIGDILGVSGSLISKGLKNIRISDYFERWEGNKRLIFLTKNGVEELLKLSEKKKAISENPSKKKSEKREPEKIEDPVKGVSFADFEKLLIARGHERSVKNIWNSLVRNHKELFVISHKDSVCFYQVNVDCIEQAVDTAQKYAKNIDAKIRKNRTVSMKPLDETRIRFLSKIG